MSSCCIPCEYEPCDLENVKQGKFVRMARLWECNLWGFDLAKQDLRAACLVEANLKNTQCKPPLLYGADLRHAIGIEESADTKNTPGRIISLLNPETNEPVFVLDENNFSMSRLKFFRYRKKAKKGNPFYQFVVALLLETFSDAKDHQSESLMFYQKAADQGHYPSMNNLGWRYEHGYGVEKSLEKAFEFYDKASMKDPVASFNVIRFSAIYKNDSSACYALAGKYRNGEAVPVDMKLSFHWMMLAANAKHPRACKYIGVMFRSGTGTEKDLEKAFSYLRFAADPTETGNGDMGDIEAQYELGVMYEFGYGTEIDYKQARYWYQKAGDRADHPEALLHLGKLCEEGKGGAVSFDNALQYYRKVANQGRISGMYNTARMLEHSPTESNAKLAVELYQKVLQQDPSHCGAMFLLATHYQRGSGIEKDVDKASRMYQESAQNGHQLAKIRDKLISEEVEPGISSEEIENRIHEAIKRFENEAEVLNQKGKLNLQLAMSVIEEYCDRMKNTGECYMNAKLLPYDPYLKDLTMLDEVTKIEIENFTAIFEEIQDAGSENPAIPTNLLNKLTRVRRSIASGKGLKVRFIRLYKAWISEEKGFPVPDEVEDRIRYRQGLIAQKLVQNIGRCCDGMSTFFSEEEIGFSLENTIGGIPIGLRICLALEKYKMKFLMLQRDPHNDEAATEGLALAIKRMRLPMGLAVVKTRVKYGYLGKHSRYTHTNLMKNFLYGVKKGDIGGAAWVEWKPFTVESVCEYLNELIDDPEDKTLSKEHISEFVMKDPVLKKAGEDAFIEFEENDYCNPFVDQNANPYKPKTLERILALHCYVSQHSP